MVCAADEYFVQRKLYPNVDFYSGIVLLAIGIPKHMFTVGVCLTNYASDTYMRSHIVSLLSCVCRAGSVCSGQDHRMVYAGRVERRKTMNEPVWSSTSCYVM